MNVSRETSTEADSRLWVASEFDVSRETMERLDRFATIFLKWNKRINLISRADEMRLWDRHIGDSLQLAPFLPPGRAADLGSGGGFPGLVLAIATGRAFTLIEADARKAAFLREAARTTGADVSILLSRIEKAAAPKAEIITARALAPLSDLLDLAVPHLAPEGVCVFLKGASAAAELTACDGIWNMVVKRHASRVDKQGCILLISEVSHV